MLIVLIFLSNNIDFFTQHSEQNNKRTLKSLAKELYLTIICQCICQKQLDLDYCQIIKRYF